MCGTSKVYCTSNLTGPKAHNIIYINTTKKNAGTIYRNLTSGKFNNLKGVYEG